jgi:hypothetical protein
VVLAGLGEGAFTTQYTERSITLVASEQLDSVPDEGDKGYLALELPMKMPAKVPDEGDKV